MGLDLWHVIPSAKEKEYQEYFTLDELEECPALQERHHHLITEITEVEKVFTIYIFSDELKLAKYGPVGEGREQYTAVLTGLMDQLGEKIAHLETLYCLPVANKSHSVVEVRTPASGEEKLYIQMLSYPISYQTERVLYFKSMGYQRKGMIPAFYEDFINCKNYFKKEDVLKAATYLDLDNKNRPELIKHFPAQFIDNFIEGASIFFASW
ncbi:hypothetical protein F0L74_24860 [Chitinophaga agrisoli]|uniref:Uncharacterized protein n=1 Tax=Chitinophaga agrisoli TaxID=2607653 RepID=A0A5B2VKC0_9BACT|nr:hypothetical protein [Chitinophaga agrisoli]KAA2239435.1 hypothetical protein F0L74_24860 [Chitinophaga agrisoli]